MKKLNVAAWHVAQLDSPASRQLSAEMAAEATLADHELDHVQRQRDHGRWRRWRTKN